MTRLLSVLALTLSLAAAGCGGGKTDATKEDDRPVVSVAVAGQAAGAGALRASGLIVYQREPALSFKVSGVIDRIMVDEGDSVRAGQRLAWLRPTEVAAGAAEANAALQVAQRNLERAQTLFDKGLVAQARLDDAKLAVDRAKAGSAAAGFARDTAVIVSPADGIVLRRLAEPAQVAAVGAPVLVVGEVKSGLIVRAAFSSAAAARLKVGQAATVKVADAGASFTGKITRIAGKGDGATGAFDAEIMVANPKGLRSGMVADVAIDTGEKTQNATVTIPALSLLDARADQGTVFVVDAQGIARRRAVQTGGVTGDVVLVLSGLKPGESVVATGAAYVRDGEPVAIVTAAR